jgi:hypothetical protein
MENVISVFPNSEKWKWADVLDSNEDGGIMRSCDIVSISFTLSGAAV